MSESCCICGLVLAIVDSEFPQWCKEIRALCQIGEVPILTGTGHIGHHTEPINLVVPSHGSRRFCFRHSPADIDLTGCYPFHTSCWSLLEESNGEKFGDDNIISLFNIFESFHYSRRSRCLKYIHDYYLEDILDGDKQQISETDIVSAHKENPVLLADPLHYELGSRRLQNHQISLKLREQSCRNLPNLPNTSSRLLQLPHEVLGLITHHLDYTDVQSLLLDIGEDNLALSSWFWKSRFLGNSEATFAHSIRPPSYSWEDWFFELKSEMEGGPNKASLKSRQRVWKLGVELCSMARAMNDPSRVLYGDPIDSRPSRPQGSVSSLALKYDTEGCRELKQVHVRFGGETCMSQLRGVFPTYTPVSSRWLISGLTFTFNGGQSVDAGYVNRRPNSYEHIGLAPKYINLACSPLGLEAISIDVYPQRVAYKSRSGYTSLGVARWPLQNLTGIYLSLDAMRIVAVCAEGLEKDSLKYALWKSLPISSTPYLCDSDVSALYTIQRESFTPASSLLMESANGYLTAIKVYSELGSSAGISAIQFLYDTGRQQLWGYPSDAASLTFFLGKTETITDVTVYKTGPRVRSIQFVTSNHRTGVLPPLPSKQGSSLERVHYQASGEGCIVGLCGCFVSPSKRLNCLGVFATTSVEPLQSCWSLPHEDTPRLPPSNYLQPMPLSIKSHGEHQSHLIIQKRYQSIQASFNLVSTTWRSAGLVTGLLFRSSHDDSHPVVLGQFTGAGPTYELSEAEHVLDFDFMTTKPRCRVMARPGLSQVAAITVVTNLRRIYLGPTAAPYDQEPRGGSQSANVLVEILWDFNAMFDRVRCIYK